MADEFRELLAQLGRGRNKSAGPLRGELKIVDDKIQELFDIVRKIVEEMERVSALNPNASFDVLWKPVSHMGFDVIRGRTVDYGNREYAAIYLMFCNDPVIADSVEKLQKRWPTLRLDGLQSETALVRKADVVEVILAALRGNDIFHSITKAWIDARKTTLPTVLNWMMSLCRLVHMFNAYFCSGSIKYLRQSHRSHRVAIVNPDHFKGNIIAQHWISDNMDNGLAALFPWRNMDA